MQQNDKQPKFKVILPEGFSLERPKQVITQPIESGRADLEEIIRQETAFRWRISKSARLISMGEGALLFFRGRRRHS